MTDPPPSSRDHLEHSRELIWEAVQMLEEAQRVLFHAGDVYVGERWGDGVRTVLRMTERLTELAGELTAAHIEIGRMERTDIGRGKDPPG
jgi:hypothetical protein